MFVYTCKITDEIRLYTNKNIIMTLRKFLRDDSVISVKIYSTSFFSFIYYYFQKIFYLLKIYID